MQDSCLEDHERSGERLFQLDFDGVRLVLGYSGHREQVGRAHEEVSVERCHAETAGCADTHDSFQHNGHRDHLTELVCELHGVL